VAGYSGTPLVKKLGIAPGHRVVVLGAEASFTTGLELPERVELATKLPGGGLCDVLMLFVSKRAELDERFAKLAAKVKPDGAIWVAWPKASARKRHRLDSDMSENAVRAVILPLGYVDNKVAAIDDIWSGLRCVLRVENRPKREPAQ
jgi:hypothetical protein